MVTLPPVIVNATTGARDDFNVVNHRFGPFEIGTDLYAVLRNPSFASSEIDVYKSTNGGSTWTKMDAANDIPDSAGFDCVEAGGVIYVIYQPNAGGGLRYQAFDTGTDTWGASVAGGPTPTITFRAVRASSGEIIVLYPSGAQTFNNIIRSVVFSGGAWGVAADFAAAAANLEHILQNALIDSADLIHVFYNDFNSNAGGNWATYHRSLTVGGVVGTADVIRTSLTNGNKTIGRPVVWTKNGTPVMALPTFTDSSTPALAAVYVSDDLTGATWQAIDTVDLGPTVSAGGDDGEVFSLTNAAGTTLYIFWIALDYTDVNNVIDRLYYAENSGAGWSAPVLMYDAVTNPQTEDPAIAPVDQDLHTLSVSFLNSGLFGILTAMEENSVCAGYYLIDGGLAPLAADCNNPPNGQVGNPYSHTFLASGGAPPYTYAITVGALPDGLTLDGNTGVVSGTPTLAGTFNFTVTATDALDNTDDVACSILISAAGLSISCNNPPNGQVGVAYSHFITASGGTPPYTFAITAGTLPPGLTLDTSTGEIAGSPTNKGVFTFTVQVTDDDANTSEVECSIQITGKCLT